MTTKACRWSGVLLATVPVLLWGCDGRQGEMSHHPDFPVAGEQAQLSRADSCEGLVDSLQEDALAKVEIATEQYLRSYTGKGSDEYSMGTSGEAERSEGAASASDSSESPEHSETNTQVEGIDEADIVKTDGNHIYLLSGNKLFILDSWPADATSLRAELTIEGAPSEMFVADGRATVFSQTADPRTAPDEDPCGDFYETHGAYRPCYSGGNQFTKITVAEIDGSEPRLARELYVQGHYRSSRRHDDRMRAVINNWGHFFAWNLPNVWEYLYEDGRHATEEDEIVARIFEWRDDAIDAIRDRDAASDWLPVMAERAGGELEILPPDCDRFYLTPPGRADYGTTQIVDIDLGDDAADPKRTGVWGQAHQLYANAETMVLAQYDYSAHYRAYLEEAERYSDWSLLHRFELDEAEGALYEGSATVPGMVLDQFSIDERDGVIRVATTQTTYDAWWACERDCTWEPPETANRVLTLRNGGEHSLRIVGSTEALAEGERIFSARFLGDLAYVVTFRQIDPLFAIDLSDPEHPRVLGELKIPGFSNYIHPLGDEHLLTIGFDADEETGRREGLALQIFDIGDPSAPSLVHKHVFRDDEWGHSEANWDHKAFTFFGSRQLLAFPYVAWGESYDSFRSSLEVFHVDAEDGFRRVGSIDHSGLLEGLCESPDDYYCRSYGMRVRRGVFIEDYVYSISHGGVRVNALGDMSRDVATVRLSH